MCSFAWEGRPEQGLDGELSARCGSLLPIVYTSLPLFPPFFAFFRLSSAFFRVFPLLFSFFPK